MTANSGHLANKVLLAALQVVVDRNRCRWWKMERCSCMALQDGCQKLFKVREAVAMLTAGGIRCLDLAHKVTLQHTQSP